MKASVSFVICSVVILPQLSLGLQFVDQLCVKDEERVATILAVSNKCIYALFYRFPSLILNLRYYALSAICALFKHAELKLNTRYSANSLRIVYTPLDGTMLIDTESARNLELVGNIGHRKSSHSLYG